MGMQWNTELAEFLKVLKYQGVEFLPVTAKDPLKDVRQEVEKCSKCRLAKTVKNRVFGEGPDPCITMLVGEGPGAEEDKTGIPFVGKAGQLLDRILAAIKLQRSDVYITNVIKCRPPSNRTPLPDEVASCMPFLERQIEIIDPVFIVALGGVAARALLGVSSSISAMRGRFYRLKDGRICMVTYHPAALLRNPKLKAPAWKDWQMFDKAYRDYLESKKIPDAIDV